MLDNLHYFNLSIQNREPLVNKNYSRICGTNNQVISDNLSKKTTLSEANSSIIENLDMIQSLLEINSSFDDEIIKKAVETINNQLETEDINYSPFCQYFNVHNINYSILIKLSLEERIDTLRFLIEKYIEDRHKLYKLHGYSDVVLQAFSDNYSHKRKGEYGVKIIANILEKNNIRNLLSYNEHNFDKHSSFFLLSDKDGKKLFEKFKNQNGIKLNRKGKKSVKYPDALIKIGEHYFIVEQKNLKEKGGGQDKQAVEVVNFIDKKPEMKKLHYVGFIDGIYFNFFMKPTGNISDLLKDIKKTLSSHKENFFVNTSGFEELIKEYINLETGEV